MRFSVVLGALTAVALIVVPAASAIRFTDAPCPEAGPGGIRICPTGVVGKPYALKLEGAGGCGPALPYTFTVINGSPPPGLALHGDGWLTGTPAQAGSWSFWLRLSDQDPPSASWCIPKKSEREFSLLVEPPPASVGHPYAVGLGGSGEASRTWQLASGEPPPGIRLDADGALSGTPQLPGSFPFKLSAMDSEGRVSTIDLVIVVAPRLTVVTKRLPATRVGHLYRARVRRSGGVRPTMLRVLSGRFPIGIRLDPNTGILRGKPRTSGRFPIRFAAHDAVGAIAVQNLTLIVLPARPARESRST